MRLLVNAVAGFLFGLGLVIGGMVDPAKVLNFLDFAGAWDPSLAFVMAGAVAVTLLGYTFVLRQPRPLLAAHFHLSQIKQVDGRLVIGAVVFGVGWGLGGFCPGPALTSLPLLARGTMVFVPAMLAGLLIVRLIDSRRWRTKPLVKRAAGEAS